MRISDKYRRLFSTVLVSASVGLTRMCDAAWALDSAPDITDPINRIRSMLQIIGFAIGSVILTYAGVQFMSSADDPHKRDDAKSTIKTTLLGLIVILVAPHVVTYII